jgi:hypothetical protein
MAASVDVNVVKRVSNMETLQDFCHCLVAEVEVVAALMIAVRVPDRGEKWIVAKKAVK